MLLSFLSFFFVSSLWLRLLFLCLAVGVCLSEGFSSFSWLRVFCTRFEGGRVSAWLGRGPRRAMAHESVEPRFIGWQL